MGARAVSLALPLLALLAIGSIASAPGLMMKWQLRGWSTLVDTGSLPVAQQRPAGASAQQAAVRVR